MPPISKEFEANPAAFAMSRITLALEYMTTTLRAVADGHDVQGEMARQPALWAYAILREFLDVTSPDGVPVAPMKTKGRRGSRKKV